MDMISKADATIWILSTAVIFTLVGWFWSINTTIKKLHAQLIEHTVDSLIEDGYIKTRGTGKDMVILKHWEE